MDALNNLRLQINEIDEKLVDLFNARMEVVSKIGEYKSENCLKVLDKDREALIVNKYLSAIVDESQKSNLKEFLGVLMDVSRKTQTEIINKNAKLNRIGFQGVCGSFSHQALIEYFGKENSQFSYQNFKDVFQALDEGDIEYGVLPIENSSTGGISEVYDLLGKYGFHIVGEKCIKVDHNLLGIKGTKIEDIKEVYSHIQGFLQCKNYLDTHEEWLQIPYFNTAKSAEYVKNENIKSKACIASKNAAHMYDLDILAESINCSSNNHTRFIIIKKDMDITSECNKVSVVLKLKHEIGTLHNALRHFTKNNSNLLKIESRPIMDKSWEYVFYIDFRGNILDDETKKLIEGLRDESVYFKLIGNYKSDR